MPKTPTKEGRASKLMHVIRNPLYQRHGLLYLCRKIDVRTSNNTDIVSKRAYLNELRYKTFSVYENQPLIPCPKYSILHTVK